MFIKKTVNSVGKTYYHLVESYREGRRVRQRTLLALGEASEGKMNQLARAIAKHQDVLEAMDLAKDIGIERTYILGPLLILEKLFERLGIRKVLKEIQSRHEKLGIDLAKVCLTLVASRWVGAFSKLGVYDRLLERLYPGLVDQGLELQSLYRALDLMAVHKEEVEASLFWHDRDLLSEEVDVVLYDLTTLRFESTREDVGTLRRFGYSKEKRTDCTQVVLGLLLNTEGIPLGFEVYPGNTFEGQTLCDMVKKLRNKFKIRRLILVADRGLLSDKNIDIVRQNGGEFIFGMKLGQLKRRSELFDLDRFNFVNDDLAFYETTHQEDRLIVTWSRARLERDRRSREDVLAKVRKALSSHETNVRKFITHGMYRRYVEVLEKGKVRLHEKAIQEDALRDGFLGVISNVKTLTAEQILTN